MRLADQQWQMQPELTDVRWQRRSRTRRAICESGWPTAPVTDPAAAHSMERLQVLLLDGLLGTEVHFGTARRFANRRRILRVVLLAPLRRP